MPGIVAEEFVPATEDDEDDTPPAAGSLTINGTLVPPSYSLTLYPDNGEVPTVDPQAA
jgi:hypothetical protein